MFYHRVSSIIFEVQKITIVCQKTKQKKYEKHFEMSCFRFQEANDRMFFSLFSQSAKILYFCSDMSTLVDEIKDKDGECYLILDKVFHLYFLYFMNYFRNRRSSDISWKQFQEVTPPVFLKTLIETAIEMKASDIHIEIFETTMRIRYRIDGSLKTMIELEKSGYSSLISQIKIFANLDIVEKRLPQDGSFSLEHKGEMIDFRVSTLPSFYGEKVVIRILHRNEASFCLESIGFSAKELEIVQKILSKKSGLILNCGPTGSGKTTTLYSFLNYKKEENINIITVEDPVEYHLYGITQVTCREEIGMTYPVILKTLLRQDPDVIMIGEIRDKETAEIAVKSALTGHLVLSTIHSKDTVQCIQRLCNLGIDTFLIAHSLSMILSQRLVKKLCPVCKEEYLVSKEEHFSLGIFTQQILSKYESKGCSQCHYLGYQGRVPLFELFICDEENKNWILSKSFYSEKKPKIKLLIENGIEKVEKGEISIEELIQNI